MRLQVLASGSGGNCALVRGGETTLMVDAGLVLAKTEQRLEDARVAPLQIDHVLVTHGHLDHARSTGGIARKARATLHCAEALMRQPSVRRARSFSTLPVERAIELRGKQGCDDVRVTAVALPHDASPTVAFKMEHDGRCAVILTDMGHPRPDVAAKLAGAHVLVLEFNHDVAMVCGGPYPLALQRRILGGSGHLSNEQACEMLRMLAGPNLHTLVLAHLSATNNRVELALELARAELERLGLASAVRTIVASQDEIGEPIEV